MKSKFSTAFFIAVFALSLKAQALSCHLILNSGNLTSPQYEFIFATDIDNTNVIEGDTVTTPTIVQNDLFRQHIRKRQNLENEVHKTVGQMNSKLEQALYKIFSLNNETRHVPLQNQAEILREIYRDPIVSELSFEAQSKMIHLIFKGYARPYMALLIARYMDEKVHKQSQLGPNILYNIDTIVLYYTIEWTIRSLLKHRMNALQENEKSEVIELLMNPERVRRHRGFSHNQLNHAPITGNLLVDFLRERENYIASTSHGHLLRSSIFD